MIRISQFNKRFYTLSLVWIFSIFIFYSNLAEAENCPSCGASKASDTLSLTTSKVVEGSIDVSSAAGSVIIESVAAAGDSLVIVVNGASEAASATIKLSGKGVQQLGLASGTVVQVSAVVTGHLLIVAGKAIAFIPNEIGKELLYQAQLK